MESEQPHRGRPPPADGMSAVQVAFPQTPDDFENDSRVSYSKLDNKYILEDDGGTEWEFDESLQKWVPSVRLLPPQSP